MSAQPVEGGKRRADAGEIRATARDALGMSWVVEMGGMPLDLLRRVTGASDPAARQMIRRWRLAKWAETGHLGAGPLWVWATPRGCAMFGRHTYDARPPSAAKLAHARAVILARLRLEEAFGGRFPEWRSEREVRWELAERLRGERKGSDAARAHLVDGTLDYETPAGARIRAGVEVELSPKPYDTLRANMTNGLDQRSGGYVQVIWFVNDRTRALVNRARQSMGDAADRILVRELTDE